MQPHFLLLFVYFLSTFEKFNTVPCKVPGRGFFPPCRFLPLHQLPGNDLTWPLSSTNPFWSGESAAAAAADTSWPRLAPPTSERSWRPLTLEGAGWNVLYLISYILCQLRLMHSRSINIWTSTVLSTWNALASLLNRVMKFRVDFWTTGLVRWSTIS